MPKNLKELEGNYAFIDGSSISFYGYCLFPENETFIVKDQPMTNNRSEWLALYTLILDLPQGWKGKVFSDSLLIVNQFKQIFRIKDPELKRINDACKDLIFQKKLELEVIWISRKENLFGKRLERELAKRKRKWKAKEK